MTRSHEWLCPRCAAPWWSQHLRRGAASAILCVAVFVGSAPTVVRAGGVVGTGTPDSCTPAALNAALGGGGLVTFNCGGLATITVTATGAINADTTVDGGGAITISGGNSVGIFVVNSGVNFTVQNLTIANGNSASHKGGGIDNEGSTLTVTNSTFSTNSAGLGGGGIYNHSGTVTVTNSTFSGNSAASTTGGGGGIGNSGTLTVSNSTFSGNSADYDGGGIGNSGTLAVTNSTFSGNSASHGGGGIGNSGTLAVTNSTFSGNSASHNGGGIASIGTVTVTNSTFSSNSAGYDGGGIASGTGTVTNSTFSGNSASHNGGGITSIGRLTVTNTIVANSTTGGNCAGSVTDGGHNIDDGTTCGLAGTSLSTTNPMLDSAGLANNGGPTQTIALQAGSPAINAGDESVCAAPPVSNLDQRGYVRPGTGHGQCSIGAYEANATPPEVCIGDCGGTATVAINDLVTLVNIALGTAQPSACPGGVPSGTEVTVAVIIQAVNNALSGCGVG
ncbi:MAG TPA: choice-of-anchor Q domain-containing protein [Candidatus Margulisiibacteriota bacterium]|nr:choice-of-anchor Q domain-containing protein [Candidatus Margulisiibacteriota bacterium]